MTEEIKARIELISSGNLPEGYVRTRAGTMPKDWVPTKTASQILKNHSDKKHNGQGEVLSATQDRGIVPRSEVDIDIKYAEESVFSYKKVESGDFVISLRSFQGGIEYSQYNGLVSPAYTVLKPILPVVGGFYKAYFKTTDFISRLNSTVYGIRDGKQIGFNDFGDMILHYPPLPEQQKIAEILTTCDKLIALKKELIAEKQNLKKSCLSKIFPKNGNNVPEIRFPGFTDAWEQRKVGELASDTFGGGTPTTSNTDFWNGSIPWIQSSDLTEHQVFGVIPRKYISKAAVLSSATKIVPENSIAIITRVGVGKLAVMPFSYATSQDFLSLSKLNVDIDFAAYLLYKKLQSELNSVQGTSIKGITKDELLAKVIFVPERKEQEAIGQYFRNLDHLITLHQRELEETERYKKALMQLLLTGIVRVS